MDNDLCQLCERHPESQDHLFFNCPFSTAIWKMILQKLNCRTIAFVWETLQEWMLSNHWCSKFQKDLVYLSLSAVVYYVWKEHNQTFHNSPPKHVQNIVGEVLQTLDIHSLHVGKLRKHKSTRKLQLILC